MAKTPKKPRVAKTEEQKAAAQTAKFAKFLDLGRKRTNKALKAIKMIENLANKNSYSYEPADAEKIIKALESAVEKVKARFATPGSKGEAEFDFS